MSPDGPATVLLTAPAILFALLAVRGESALLQRPLAVIRTLISLVGFSLFLVAGEHRGRVDRPLAGGPLVDRRGVERIGSGGAASRLLAREEGRACDQ